MTETDNSKNSPKEDKLSKDNSPAKEDKVADKNNNPVKEGNLADNNKAAKDNAADKNSDPVKEGKTADKKNSPVVEDKLANKKNTNFKENKPSKGSGTVKDEKMAGKNNKYTSNPSASNNSNKPKSKSKLAYIFILLLLVLVVILAVVMFYQNRQLNNLQDNLQEISQSNVNIVKSAESKANQALSLAQEQNEKVIALNKIIDKTNNQLQEIDRSLQMVSDGGTDLLLLNDIDHLITIAQQQLSLGGNVANAIISLEAAQAQLARANRSAFVSLQQSINGDLDKLRAVATVNLPALSEKIDNLVILIDKAPLIVPDSADNTVDNENNSAERNDSIGQNSNNSNHSVFDNDNPVNSTEYWSELSKNIWENSKKFSKSLSQDFRQLFDIRKVNDEAALLMSPDQARRFRETLSQRAITAQLALLMGQTKIWKDELEKISGAIDKRFDMHSENAREALNLARELHDTSIEIKLPDLNNSLSAIAAVRDDLSAEETDNASVADEIDESAAN